jgi:hypothetical protein
MSFRIPVYRSRAISRETMPGTELRGTVRRNPRAEAQFEMDKAAPMLAAFEGVTKFAAARWQASQEAQFNEAALAIEEGMREAEYTLSKTKDIYNVLDGNNLWQNSMDELRDVTISSVSNRSLQRKLKYSFEQNEIAARFRLRGEIDKKILAREQAAIAARMEKKRYNLSQPGTTIDQYNTEMNIVTNDQARGVAGGRYSIEGVNKANLQLRADIAASYIQNVYSNDPDKAMQLFAMMDLQDEVAAGTKTPEQAMAAAGIDDEYALHVLYNVERGTAVKIIQENLATSLKFFDAEEKLETERQEETNGRNKKAYNFFFSVQDSEIVEPEILRQLIGSQAFENLSASDQGGVTGLRAKDILQTHLNNQFWATREQQARMNEEMDTSTQFKFAPTGEGSEARYSELYALAERGMLTVEELNTDTFRITAQQHRELSVKIYNEADESLAVGSRLLKRAFKYNELDAQTDNPTLARASKSAFENADYALQNEFSRRESEGNPMTLAEIRAFANEQIELFGESFRDELRIELEDYIRDNVREAFIGINIDLTDPITSLENYYNQQSQATQDLIRSRITTYKRVIRSRFGNQGLGF